ncbi:MAG TPA: 30S ribosome-binding factor RbfA [Vicinamibacterales bacterium]|nr:30S ribosome-binding factor RbfA [Vicinamibacterales bacterium]
MTPDPITFLQYNVMAQGHRPDRVGEEIRQELSELISRGGVHDPGIGFITLTRVKVSPDLQVARVFYTTMGDATARRETAKALERATPFFRRHIGGQLRLRRVPELEFRFDESIANQDRIEQILRGLHEEEAQRAVDRADSKQTADDAGSKPLDDARGAQSDSRRAEQDPAYSDDKRG